MPTKTNSDIPKSENKNLEVFGAEVPPCSFDLDTHIVSAIKVGTVAHTSYGEPYECTADWMEAHAEDWTNGALIANHNGETSEKFGSILRSWYDHPFIMMEIGNMNQEAEQRMLDGEHTGFSFDAIGDPYYPEDIQGTNLSILFYPHAPACSAEDGCGLAAEDGNNTKSNSQNVKTEDIQKHIGSEAMAEDKTYTRAEIDSMKSEAAEVAAELATLKAEAKTHESGVAALKAEIAERTGKISELTDKADTLFAAEDVEKKVEEAKETMFSAEAVETAKTEAVEKALAAEKEKTELIAAGLDAVNKMFPDGLEKEFRESVVAMIMDGKTHDALVKIGNGINFSELKASIPTGDVVAGSQTEPVTDGFTVGDCKGV
jgi:predicted DNA-binding protein